MMNVETWKKVTDSKAIPLEMPWTNDFASLTVSTIKFDVPGKFKVNEAIALTTIGSRFKNFRMFEPNEISPFPVNSSDGE